jgi:pilus assembly protein CpaB
MKLTVVILIMLGLLAAGSAVLLVNVVQKRMEPGVERDTVPVLVAREKLPARKLIDEADLEVKPIPKTGLPRDYFTNVSQAVGKVLKMAVVKGEPLTDAVFIPKGSVDELLRPGMLAFPAPLPRRTTAVTLLYPGCVVDVFATFPLRDADKGDAVVTPLLQNIQVLGIEDVTVVSQQEGGIPKSSSNSSGNVTVTLEVNARQAAALQLALERGTLGLAMRNPLDKNWNSMEPMVIKEGQLTAASETLDPATLALFNEIQHVLLGDAAAKPAGDAKPAPAPVKPQSAVSSDANLAPVQPMPELPGIAVFDKRPKTLEVQIIRGQNVTSEEVPLEQGASEEANK